MIDKKCLKIFDIFVKANLQFLERYKHITCAIIIIKKDYSLINMILIWKNSEEKELMREKIKEFIINQKIKGYCFVSDGKLTKMMDSDVKVIDVLINSLYTPKGKINRFFQHNGKGKDLKEIEEYNKKEFQDNFNSEWDLFSSEYSDETDEKKKKIMDDYNKYKQEHKDKYKDVL